MCRRLKQLQKLLTLSTMAPAGPTSFVTVMKATVTVGMNVQLGTCRSYRVLRGTVAQTP
jgi:hypothetical protein